MPTIRNKDFDPNDNILLKGVPKPLPSLYSDADLLFEREIMENRLNEFDTFVGCRRISGEITANEIIVNSGASTINIVLELEDFKLRYKGIVFPETSIYLDETVPFPDTNLGRETRTYSVWLKAERIQYVHSDKLNTSKNLLDSTKPVADDSIGGVTVDDPNVPSYTVEGMDFFSYSNPELVFLREDDVPAYDGEKIIIDSSTGITEFLCRVFTIELVPSSGSEPFELKSYDISGKLPLDLSNLERKNLSFFDYLFSFEDLLLDKVENRLSQLDDEYGRLKADNQWENNQKFDGQTIKKVSEAVLEQVLTPNNVNPDTTGIDDSAIYYAPGSRQAVIVVNDADIIIINWPEPWVPIINKVLIKSSNLPSSYYKHSTIYLNMPNVDYSQYTPSSQFGINESAGFIRINPNLSGSPGSLFIKPDRLLFRFSGIHTTNEVFHLLESSSVSPERLQQDISSIQTTVSAQGTQISLINSQISGLQSSQNSANLAISLINDVDWQNISVNTTNFENGSLFSRNARYHKDSRGQVFLSGWVKANSTTASLPLTSTPLPAPFRPTSSIQIPMSFNSLNEPVILSISSSGELIVFGSILNNNYCLDGISFFTS